MTGSRGAIVVNPLYTTEEMKISNPEVNVDRVIREFLRIGEAVAGKWIEMPNGVLFLQMPPENPADGAVYVYDRKQRLFYQIDFEAGENLTEIATWGTNVRKRRSSWKPKS